MPATRPPYPPEFRREAVRLVRESGRPKKQIARELGVTSETDRRWVRSFATSSSNERPSSTLRRFPLIGSGRASYVI